MSEEFTGNTPFASQLDDINRYITSFKSSKNFLNNNKGDNTPTNYTNNFNLKNVRNTGNNYGKSNDQYSNQFNNGYQNSLYAYKNVNQRKDNYLNSNGLYNRNNNNYYNSKKKGNFNNNEFNMNMNKTYKSYNNNSNNNMRRQKNNYNNNNGNVNTIYNQNVNFTNHLRETYPQFYSDFSSSNKDHNDTNIPEPQHIDPHRQLLETSLYNTYSQNSSLNNFNNYPSGKKDTTGDSIPNQDGSTPSNTIYNDNNVNGNNGSTNSTSLFEKFNIGTLGDNMSRLSTASGNDATIPGTTGSNSINRSSNQGSSIYGDNINLNTTSTPYSGGVFENPLSPMSRNEIKLNGNMMSIAPNMMIPSNEHNNAMTSPNPNAFSTPLSPSNTFIGSNEFMTPSNGTLNGNNTGNRNMYLSQTMSPNYNNTNNNRPGTTPFPSFGWNTPGFNSNSNQTEATETTGNITNGYNSINSSSMNKSFGIWGNDMKVWS